MRKANYLGMDILLDDRTSKYGGSFMSDLTVNDVEKVKLVADFLKVKENPILLDIGACTGSYTLLPLIVNGLHVHSFEPSKSFDVLLSNINLNKISSSVTLNRKAVSNKNSKGSFNEIISEKNFSNPGAGIIILCRKYKK